MSLNPVKGMRLEMVPLAVCQSLQTAVEAAYGFDNVYDGGTIEDVSYEAELCAIGCSIMSLEDITIEQILGE